MTQPPGVLVVDDSDDHRFIAVTELQRLKLPKKLRIEEAATGDDALQQVAKMLRDGLRVLVFSDYRMPKMGGIELLKAIRQRWPKEPVRVVIYSSTDQGVGDESLSSGADEFMVKPMELFEFRRELRRAVDAFLGNDKAPAPNTR
ncbi:MAG TPA: response regulator [Candidatus Thermoplasmatota archaeon]